MDWLSAQLADNGSTFPGFAIGTSPARTDWGLTADAVLSFIAAGQGSNLGYRFEQIGDMIDATKESDRLRVCFDTEHALRIAARIGLTEKAVEHQIARGVRLSTEFLRTRGHDFF